MIMNNEQVKKIREMLQEFDTALLVTHGIDAPFHARPMAIARVEANCDVWFSPAAAVRKFKRFKTINGF